MTQQRRIVPITQFPVQHQEWLWEPRIPFGALTIFEGDPGTGKSSALLDLLGRITTGRTMPLAEHASNPGTGIVLAAEDRASNIRNVLTAAGADLSQIHVYDKLAGPGHLSFPADIDELQHVAEEVQPRLIIIDPIAPFLSCNTGNEVQVRSALAPLAALAEEFNTAIVLVRHLTKTNRGNPLYRGAGSMAFIASARSALLATRDPSSADPFQRILVQIKSNLAAGQSVAYRTVRQGDVISAEWIGPSVHTVATLSASEAEHSALYEAATFLYRLLRDGPMAASQIKDAARDADIALRTLDRAKRVLRVERYKTHGMKYGKWFWRLPDDQELLRPFADQYVNVITDALIHDNANNGPVTENESTTADSER